MRHLLLLCAVCAIVSGLHAQPAARAKTKVDIALSAVDLEGRPLTSLVAGEYVRLRVRGEVGQLPAKATLAIGAKVTFKTTILGQPVSYTLNLPSSGTAGSLLNPAVGVPQAGQPLLQDLPQGVVEEIFDFRVPPETPAGQVQISIRLSGSGLAPFKKTFTFNLVRPS